MERLEGTIAPGEKVYTELSPRPRRPRRERTGKAWRALMERFAASL